jgi:dipeptidyl-peptidase-4
MKTFLRHAPKGPTLRELYTRPLTYGQTVGGMTFSADGKILAFLWNEKGGAVRDLFVKLEDGSVRKLTDAAKIKNFPCEDDVRDPRDVAYAEEMYTGVSEFSFVNDTYDIVFLCRGNLFICDLSGNVERLTLTSGGQYNLCVPEKAPEAFFVKGGNLYSYDLDHGTVRQLTFLTKPHTSVCGYRISPDGKYAAVLVEDSSTYEDIRMPDYTPEKEVRINNLRRNNVGKPLALFRYGFLDLTKDSALLEYPELPNFKPEECKKGTTVRPHAAAWSPDGSSFAFAYVEDDYRTYHLCEASIKKGWSVKERFSDYLEPWIEWSPIAYDKAGTIYFLSYRDGWLQLYALKAGSKMPKRITDGGYDIASFAVCENGRIYFTALKPDPRKAFLYAKKDAADPEKRVKCSDRCWESFTVSRDGKQLAVLASSLMEPPVLLTTGAKGKFTQILDTASPLLKKWPRAIIKEFSFKNKEDGLEICGTLTLPRNFDPKKKYPAVLRCVYAGQGKMGFGRYNLLDNYMANEMGYILVGIDLRASHGYGHKFAQGYYKSLGIVDSKELVSCAEYLKAQPFVDEKRIGVWGGSYGGFLTLMVMCDFPGVFNTGVSWKPVTDWRNYWDSYTAPRLGRPKDDPEIYKATSPVFHAAGLEGNLLLIHGMQDDNVLFQDAAWMIQQLIEKQKYFDLMIYPKDNHGLDLRYESLPDCMERIAAYFEEHMGLGPLGDKE